jgi:3-(3-hydroxy-phenyl)propionate hydroxylase
MTQVTVVGAGPTGMMLAGELALAGIDVHVIERRAQGELLGSRAGGIHSRTIEILDQRGIADRFLAVGHVAQTARFGTTVLDISDFPTRHPYGLALWQNRFEPILASWILELGVPVHWEHEVTGLSQDNGGVELELADDQRLRADYVVGADGGRSTIRKAAGIEFPGWPATRSNLVAEVEVSEVPPAGVRQDERGSHGLTVMADGRTFRVVTTEQRLVTAGEPTLTDLAEALKAVYGTDFGVHNPTWISRFTDATRQAATYRSGRVLLAGDAAHIHYPAGGQGIGLGIQDAVNLGWKLAQVVKGISPESLLDSYQAERHPAGARALRHSMAQSVLQRHDPRTVALTETVDGLMAMDQPRNQIAALIHGLDVVYELGQGDLLQGHPLQSHALQGHPLLGRRMPDLDIRTTAGPTTVFALLRQAKAVLLNFDHPELTHVLPWSDLVTVVKGRFSGKWELPVLGEVAAPSAVLVRPDGHVAWVGKGTEHGLRDALAVWFGPGAGA